MSAVTPILTNTSRYSLREDGVVVQKVFAGCRQTLRCAKENKNIEALNRIAEKMDRPAKVLVDMRAAFNAEPDARDYYGTEEATVNVQASALLVDSLAGRLIGNFFLTVFGPRVPVRMFTSEQEAVTWLKQQ